MIVLLDTDVLLDVALDRVPDAEHAVNLLELLVVANDESALALAQTPLRLPADLPEWLSPLVSIVPAQLFCYHLTRAMGYDTEAPRRLHKVTRTW